MNLPFADASFDAAVCGLGLNYIPHPARGLEEFCRVTRSGGTVAAYLWDIDAEAAASDQARRFPICTPEGLRFSNRRS
jgi:ubiquinone/menaquinone biosynthesis C-methylase UbiE